ncbi:ESCRT-II complex subunit VPS22 [Cryptococcus gattii Ru294]|uniref:Negative regulation of transcription by glucose-related protein, putative n=2 Tax=Cryptococcus gattii TaxID=37769 RepID=E6R826_CRYGW|nr:Negative regulation of transcription by glucose-related protein, putative [Cryptococcus gattii WM276]KIR50972.1 ESCRT-II complex subunit VPS22 [Cryptococcus gattii Ru294]KIR82621.1 ESCRT-II complex subunit VPS22 [Cryptococcus gattii EJB2]KIY33711.1 ESCRT-II complex subunit VPS22 [Cryptococcus gattii E566]KJE01766.1 ESCRT-II complex subunit VPS22 [Cryptococcus gattii NT-10]ADV23009.1 Negative regulation of transcription by glucose-related protein, putative [Cryptococcus gattii WM276]
MRKGAGISGLTRHTATASSYSTLSSNITTSQLSNLTSSLQSFRAALINFASAHRADIRKDPAFRHQFQKMCAAIGVDPLAVGPGAGGSGRGWWSEVLGIGEWEYELAVQVVDICVSTRPENGGMIEMGELIRRVERLRSEDVGQITSQDILRTLKLLRPLNAGYTLHHPSPSTTYIRTIPRSLDTDQSTLLAIAATTRGRLHPAVVREQTGWTEVRVRTAMEDCVMREGLGWIDEQAGDYHEVWIIAATEFATG